MKKVLAVILDIILGVLGTGWLLTRLTGSKMTFQLEGTWFFIWLVAIVLYFILPRKLLGQSIGGKILKIAKK